MKVSRNTAARYTHLWRRARIRGGAVLDAGETVAARPSRKALDRIAAEAADRGVSRGELIAELLETITDHDLFETVLDRRPTFNR